MTINLQYILNEKFLLEFPFKKNSVIFCALSSIVFNLDSLSLITTYFEKIIHTHIFIRHYYEHRFNIHSILYLYPDAVQETRNPCLRIKFHSF